MTRPLFADKTPESAARQLSCVLASATEYHLATLERISMRKSTSKSDLQRQQDICDQLVFHCSDLRVDSIGLRGRLCTRLDARLAQATQEKV